MRHLIVVLGLLALMLAPVAVAAAHAPSLDAAGVHGHDHGTAPAGDAAAQSHDVQVHDGSDHDHPLTAMLPRGQAQVAPGVVARWRLAHARRGEADAKGPLRPPRIMSARHLFG
jgi:hypothetical protein